MNCSIETKWLDASVTALKGIAKKRAGLLRKMGIDTVRDLLLHLPLRYEDRSVVRPIMETVEGEECTIIATIASNPAHSRPRKNLSLWRLSVSDGSGHMIVVLFNQDFAVKNVQVGDRFLFFGTVKRQGVRIEMANPVFDKIKEDDSKPARVVPIYGLTAGLSQNQLRTHIQDAMKKALGGPDLLPDAFLNTHGLMLWDNAMQMVHFPEQLDKSIETARKRLAFDELLELEIGIQVQRRDHMKKIGPPMGRQDLGDVLQSLPFSLMAAQSRVLDEMLSDMEKPLAMNRLLQGDVGSGKTVVAFLAAVSAIRAGYQTVLMVPTEILAEQHLTSAKRMLEPFNIRVSLLKGNMKKRERDRLLQQLVEGGPDLVIGTHALLTEDVVFHKLGLVITDEQHRFGVRQRAALAGKGTSPHVLVMTATPIPRTLSLLVYGDLDISVLDGLPPGRKPIRTYIVKEAMRSRIEAFIRKTVQERQQVYVVCPLVAESEEMQAQSAEEMAERLQHHVFPDLCVGLIHGKMKTADKEDAMAAFLAGRIDVLVATTVIEVGVNVPNATVMVIENAERFGLSQLHQLRGRVGRGGEQSHCILFQNGGGKVANERLKAIEESTDGFLLAETDLKLRGPGEMFGTQQHGLPECHIANLYEDLELLQLAKDYATYLASQNAQNTMEVIPASTQEEMLYDYLLQRFSARLRPLIMN